MDINADLLQWFYKFPDKTSSVSDVKNDIIPSIELSEKLHQQYIRKFEKREVYSSFKDNISFLLWVMDIIANMNGLFF